MWCARQDVVACHICEHAVEGDTSAAAGKETVIRYFDRAGLKDFLFSQEKLNDGCLQKFVRPKGLFNSMIQAAWSPQMCLLERRVNLHPLLSGRAPLQERTATYEGSEHLSRITPVRGTLLADRVQQLCTEMVDHIASASTLKQKIKRMLINFKTDVHDNIWFLWCSSVRLVQDDELADASTLPPSPVPRASGHGASLASLSGAGDPGLSPVCLNPAMSSPSKELPSKQASRAAETVCPFTGRPLDNSHPFFVTYKNILDYSAIMDVRLRIRRAPDEVPPLLARVCPDLDGEQFARERANPLSLFMYTRVLCSEAAYLDFSITALPGVKVLPALSTKARRSLLAPSASAPVLPQIDHPSSRGMLSRQAQSMQRLPALELEDESG